MKKLAPSSPRGVGIGLRLEHHDVILETTRRIDWLEIVPENFVETGGQPRELLRTCAKRWQVIGHGVSTNLGGRGPLNVDYIQGLKRLLDEIDAPYYTDHLCYASIDGVAYHDLLPLPYTDEAVHHCAARIRELSDRLERPVAVENISYYATMPGSSMTHGSFVRAVCESADCGLLLDVNNVYVNACNHRGDASEWLHALPLERTMQMHIAGHILEGERIIDNHGEPICDGVWSLFREALGVTGRVPVLLEWDTNIPSLDRVLDEADAARAIYDEVLGPDAGSDAA
ncbi:MAG: DUF692 domain-containing protein [Myxococcota bacterium]